MSVINARTSKDDLIKHIREVIGINPPDDATKEDLYTIIKENGGEVAGEPKAGVDTSKDNGFEDASSKAARLEKTFVRIKLFDKADDKMGQITVVDPLTYNLVTIKRNVEVTVNYPIYDGLKNAITIQVTQDPKTHEEIRREIQTEPFQVIAFDVNPADYPNE